MKAWLIRACLLACMARDRVVGLSGASRLTRDSFARACPDSKQWFTKLSRSSGSQGLRAFFNEVGYAGKPEMFSMYACVLLNDRMHVNPSWLEENADACKLYSREYECEHGLEPVPALVVAAVKMGLKG